MYLANFDYKRPLQKQFITRFKAAEQKLYLCETCRAYGGVQDKTLKLNVLPQILILTFDEGLDKAEKLKIPLQLIIATA